MYLHKILQSVDECQDIASRSSVVFETIYSVTEKTQFLGFMFP